MGRGCLYVIHLNDVVDEFCTVGKNYVVQEARSSTASPPSLVTRSSGPGSTSLRGQPVALWCRPMATSIKPEV